MARRRAGRYHGCAPLAAPQNTAVLEKVFPAIVVACCLVLLLRLVLGDRRHRFDRAIARWSRAAAARIEGLFTWNASRRRARRAAEEAIRRARDGGEWDGNVYRPKSFGKRKDRKIH
jgi:hypothetical protein